MIVLIFVVVEFCYYWFYCMLYCVCWFWVVYVLYYSGEVMNFMMVMCQLLLNVFVGVFLFYLLLVWFGILFVVVLFLFVVDFMYQYFVYIEVIGWLLCWFEYVFDMLLNYCVYYGCNLWYIDCNYGGVLIIFDWMFGIYVEEMELVDYGIMQQICLYNFFVLNVYEFVDMWCDVFVFGLVLQCLKYLWMLFEWEWFGYWLIYMWSVEWKGGKG